MHSPETAAAFELILPYFPLAVQNLIIDDTVSDLMINPSGAVFTERRGKLQLEPIIHIPRAQVQAAAENILALVGGYITQEHPIQDGRLPDGSRVAVVGPPCSADGFTVTIRKFNHWFTLQELINQGSIPGEFAHLLLDKMKAKKNVLISGGTSSGKSTLLNALVNHVPVEERIIVIEKPTELEINRENVVRWEAVDGMEGRAEVTVGQLLAAALRHRPDRIIVGEVRDASAYDLLQALNTGHSGTCSTVHADSALSALERISGLSLAARPNLNHGFVRSETARAFNVAVHVGRDKTGKRRVEEILNVIGYSQKDNEFLTEIYFKA